MADECLGLPRVRHVVLDRLSVYLSENGGEAVWLDGYTVEDHPAADPRSEEIELPEGITLGTSHADAVTLYPDRAYRHESLELDGIVFETAHFLGVIGQASDDGSAPADTRSGSGPSRSVLDLGALDPHGATTRRSSALSAVRCVILPYHCRLHAQEHD